MSEPRGIATWRARVVAIGLLVLAGCGTIASVEPASDDGGAAPDGVLPPGADAGASPDAPETSAPAADGGLEAGKDAGIVLGTPIIVAPAELESWVWVPIPSMRCADDTPSGVGVNFTTKSRELVVFFQGNGVCYDALTCNLFENLLVGMGSDPLDHMWWGNPEQGKRGLFDRSDATNPFRASNFVVLPHCTVDGHTADKDTTYPGVGLVHQHGYANATRALERILPTFLDATRVVVAGYSAGGIGATANYHQIATAFEAFGKPPPFLVDDSGPILRPPFLSTGAQKALRDGWGFAKTIDTFCPSCASQGIHHIYETLAALHPGLRSAQLCAYGDSTVTSLYRLLNGDLNVFDGTKLKNGLLDLDTWSASYQAAHAPSAHRSFFFEGNEHGALVAPLASRPGLANFTKEQLSGSAAWASVKP